MKYQLLQTLLPLLEQYERQHPASDGLAHFAAWLTRQTTPETQGPETAGAPEQRLAQLLAHQHRYARLYARKALENSPMNTWDEYHYLLELGLNPGISKIELIQRNRHEKPTGMDIIRRLLADGLIEQANDPRDKRSKVLQLSAAGQTALQHAGVQMNKVYQLMAGKLGAADRMHLQQLLEKLEAFHLLLWARR
jgi:MarR family transcriptional regulator, lower aerobic nicotinate degradation pathway regulator